MALCATTTTVPLSFVSTFTSILSRSGRRFCTKTTANANNNIMRVLNVAEKNDAAKGISFLLSNGNVTRRESRSKYNKIYQFDLHVPGLGQSQMCFTSVSGHLMNYEFDRNYKGWLSVPPSELFAAPIHRQVTNDDIAATLTEEARKAHCLIIWTDCDREGENIGDEIVTICRQAKPNLDVKRARFSEITKASVRRAIQTLQPGLDTNLSDAVDCRQQLDLRTGAAFTRLITLHVQRNRSLAVIDHQGIVSYGSCQIPTLGFVVERYRERQQFQSEPFWKLVLKHTKDGQQTTFNWDRRRVFEKAIADTLLQDCLQGSAQVSDMQQRDKRRYRPKPLETVALEKAASRKLRMTAKRAMAAAEKLYGKGVISYPRTETDIFPKSLNLDRLVEAQTESPTWGEFAASIQPPNPRQGHNTDEAHPPIHPLKWVDPNILPADEKSVFEFVARHFLACVSRDALGFETRIVISFMDEGEAFHAIGLQIVDQGYLEVYPYDRWNDQTLPMYEVGEEIVPDSVTIVESKTEPPPLLTEADLIALMEKHGIGTDATHAEHIEKIQERMYTGVGNDKRFVPSFLGLGLVGGFDTVSEQISKPVLRAETEAGLKDIAEGRRQKDDVLREEVEKYRQLYRTTEQNMNGFNAELVKLFPNQPPQARNQAGQDAQRNQLNATNAADAGENLPNELSTGVLPCPRCGIGALRVRRTREGGRAFLGCVQYPDCNATRSLPTEGVRSVRDLPDRCDNCREAYYLVEVTFERGGRPQMFRTNTYTGCLSCDQRLLQWQGAVPGGNAQHQQQRNMHTNTAGAPPNVPPINCTCGQNAMLRQTKKAGPNQGRWFQACAKQQNDDTRCNFFAWVT